MAWIAWRPSGEIYSILTKFIDEDDMKRILERVGASPGDFILFSADSLAVSRRVTGALRLKLAELLELRDPEQFAFAIVTDFPMFEYSQEDQRYVAQHHPFTMPFEEDLPFLESDPTRVRSQAYDFVLNGTELGSGSIRIHRDDIQIQVFRALGLKDEEIVDRFGFMLNAFRYGAPPHGGFAFGLDRLVMILAGEQSLRDVIAFPKIRDASCPMTMAPSTVDADQLAPLGICLTELAPPSQGEVVNEQEKKARVVKLDLKKLEQQSRLSLTPEEEDHATAQLMELIDFADALHNIDTEGVPPLFTPSESRNIHLTERDAPRLSVDEALQNAPEKRDGFFLVPPVVE